MTGVNLEGSIDGKSPQSRDDPVTARADVAKPNPGFVRYDLITWDNIVALYRTYPG